MLDKDLNLQSFIVNEKKKSFEPFSDLINLSQLLKIDPDWLTFNNDKPEIDFEIYK